MLERLLSKKVEAWVVLVVALLGLVGMLIFGMLIGYYQTGGKRLGFLAPVALGVAETPATLTEAYEDLRNPTKDLQIREQDRFPGESGFTFAYDPGTRPDAPYLMVNRYDGDLSRSVSELVDLNTQDLVHRWEFDVDPIWAASTFRSSLTDLQRDHPTWRFRNYHTLLNPDGSVLVHSMKSPLVKFDLCGNPVWQQPAAVFHHSIERDPDGNYWLPTHIDPKTAPFGEEGFLDNAITLVSDEGEILYTKSLIEIFDDNGMVAYTRGMGRHGHDPLHINDIQPVFEDGVLWRKGDLWFSLRNRSMLMLYRPATNKVLWYHIGPWVHQHDVNIVDDRTITVFDNAAPRMNRNDMRPDPINGAWIIDVPTETFTPIHPEGFKALDVRTARSGRGRLLDDGQIFVEETNYGRLLIFDETGTPDMTFINRAEQDGRIFRLNWSRIVDRDTGDAVRALVDGGSGDGTCAG